MDKRQDMALAALMEHLIEHGAESMGTVFAQVFDLAMQIERERFLGAQLYERNPDRQGPEFRREVQHPRRFDIGKVAQGLKECCHAIVCTSVGGRKRPDRDSAGGRPIGWRHRAGAWPGEIHHLAGIAAKFLGQRTLLAATRCRSLSVAQAA